MKWKKIRVGDFLIRVKDLIPIEKNKEYNLITIKLYHKGVQLRRKESGSRILANKMSRVKAGQFILSGIDARNGAFGIIPDDLDGAVVTNDFWHFDIDESIVSKEYFLWLTNTPFFDDICKKASDGTTNRIRLQADRFYSQELKVPEIEDQHGAVEELKKQSNKIGLLKIQYQKQRSLLDQLSQAILEEAMQGKLVKQDLKDEPACKLLQRLQIEKAEFGKKERAMPFIKREDVPFEIPKNWVWCRLGEISDIKRGKGPKYSDFGIKKMLNQKCVRWYDVDLQYCKAIDNDWFKEISDEFKVRQNDVLVNSTGDGTIGRSALAGQEVSGYIFDSHILKVTSSINQLFICYFINSKYGQKQVENSKGAKSTKQHELGVNNLSNFVFPLPPLSEQKRIVAEVERQFAKIQQLKENIIASQQAIEQLFESLLLQMFERKLTEYTTEKPNEKTIELKSSSLDWDNLEVEPFERRAAQAVNNIQNIDWEIAIMVACMKNKLGVTYGDVGLQKNVFNTNYLQPIFSKQYDFINSNFGTYSYELKDALKSNPYLISKKLTNNKEVYIVNPKYSKQVLNKLSAPENKEFVQAVNNMLSIYEHPFINKETDKIELYNTVLKVATDKRTTDINVIYQGMKNWKINQPIYKTKAEKFSKSDSGKMLKILIEKGIL
ncbi:restriction endonuclease subunit S [Chitinophaga rhizophila]|uniref:Restriction endonuclease subunit S n=1 Tax=Chitinophaga rhizophila TaxID=2866212 RepID=A0ABS7G797_9BACT|nr:restriction endonuclease subunit S [Chitinophaga rhizophila]MBW8683538.1 restriction endonuclease subunit S [Chitinophaga rhizophila]